MDKHEEIYYTLAYIRHGVTEYLFKSHTGEWFPVYWIGDATKIHSFNEAEEYFMKLEKKNYTKKLCIIEVKTRKEARINFLVYIKNMKIKREKMKLFAVQ